MPIRSLTLGQLWRFLAIALPALAALLVPMPAVDLAYQLRAGADIVGGVGIPTHDAWTFTVAGQPWLDQQWGAQAILALVFQLGGWTGLAVLRAALVALTMWLVQRAVRSAWSIASVRAGGSAIASSARTETLIVLVAFVLAMPALALRPQLFGVVLFAGTVLILVERSRLPRRLWLIPVLTALWVNLHGSFPLVLVLIALAWLDEVALVREPLPPGAAAPPRRARVLAATGLAIIGAVSLLATLANPVGVDVWQYLENLARDPQITGHVSEWRPPSPLEPAGALFYASLLLVGGVVAFRFRSDAGRPPARFVAPLVAVLAFGVLGVVTGRGLAWWAVVAPVAMVSLQPGLRLADVRGPGLPALRARTAREASASESRQTPLNTIVVVVLLIAAVALLPSWRRTGPAGVPTGTLSYAPQGMPVALRSLVDGGSLPPGAKVWNPQLWGSWLEYAAPEFRYATDSRIELFPAEVWRAADGVAAGNLACLAPYAPDAVIAASTEAALLAALEASAAWRQTYHDEEGSIWLPTGAPGGGATGTC